MGLQVPEDPHDSSTDTCLTFPFSSGSPRPFPPSPVHSVTDSPIGVSPLTIITNNPSGDDSPIPILSPIHRSSGHNSPTPTSSTPPVLTFSQTFTSLPSIQTTNPSNNPFYSPYFSSSLPHSGPIVFPGSPPEFPYFGILLPRTSSTFSETASLPYCPIPSRIAPTAKPKPFFSIESQSMASSPPCRRHGSGSTGTHSGSRRAPKADEEGQPPPPVARPLPFAALFGLTINHLFSLLRVLLLMKPYTWPPGPEPLTISLIVFLQALLTMIILPS